MKAIEPIFTIDLYPKLHKALISLLTSLKQDDWHKPTAAPNWTVKDIAAHLLDGDVRRLSFQRDGLVPANPGSEIDFVDFLNQLNAEWVKSSQRMSMPVITAFLAYTGQQVHKLFAALDPFGEAFFPVAWAGDSVSTNWFDIAREYTERWHHQQQIREAVAAKPITSRKWLQPVLDTFLRALPHVYDEEKAESGTTIVIDISGEAGDEWTLIREEKKWQLFSGAAGSADCTIHISDNITWRLMTKQITPEFAQSKSTFNGNLLLSKPFFNTLSIMAKR